MNDQTKTEGIGFFQKYLSLWVMLCMVVGVLIGKFLPSVPNFLNRFEYAEISIPIAILIWLMIYPIMIKVDFQSIKNVRKNPKGLFVTWVAFGGGGDCFVWHEFRSGARDHRRCINRSASDADTR